MAKKYIVSGKIYEDNGTSAVIVNKNIVIQDGGGRIMSSLVNHGGLAGRGGIAGIGGGLAS